MRGDATRAMAAVIEILALGAALAFALARAAG